MLEMKTLLTEIMNAFDGLICRLDRDKQRIKLLKDRSIEIFQMELQREKINERTELPRNLGQFQKIRVRVIGIPEEESKNKVKEILEEITAKNFSKLMIDTKLQIQEAQS